MREKPFAYKCEESPKFSRRMSMPTWTCPNTKCPYDKELQPRQHCPLCGKEAKDFKFSELGNLLKRKWSFKRSQEKTEEYKRVLGKTKFCPKCGSTNIFWASGLPQFWSLWKCKKCGYQGALVLEDSKLAVKLRKEWNEKSREKYSPR